MKIVQDWIKGCFFIMEQKILSFQSSDVYGFSKGAYNSVNSSYRKVLIKAASIKKEDSLSRDSLLLYKGVACFVVNDTIISYNTDIAEKITDTTELIYEVIEAILS